jgi:hypothetical protein
VSSLPANNFAWWGNAGTLNNSVERAKIVNSHADGSFYLYQIC